jgi:hypothetical protein
MSPAAFGMPSAAHYPDAMPGAIAIVIALLLIPVLVVMSGAVASAIIGETFFRTTRTKFDDSELRDLPD